MNSDESEKVADIGSSQADLDASTERYANRFRGKGGARPLSCQASALRKLVGPDRSAGVLDVGVGHRRIAAQGNRI